MGAQSASSTPAGVSISLEHYQQSAECFSKWGENELKKFADMVGKLRGYSYSTLVASKICCKHKRAPGDARFSLPAAISSDRTMYELRVDGHNAARVHGVFAGEVFQLVWLDRKHRVFPER